MVLVQIYSELTGDLFFGGRPSQSLLRGLYRRLYFLCALSMVRRDSIQSANAIENRAADSIFGVGAQGSIP